MWPRCSKQKADPLEGSTSRLARRCQLVSCERSASSLSAVAGVDERGGRTLGRAVLLHAAEERDADVSRGDGDGSELAGAPEDVLGRRVAAQCLAREALADAVGGTLADLGVALALDATDADARGRCA